MEKPWEEVTRAERVKQKKEKCRFCKYALLSTAAGTNIDIITCDYIGITGHSRGCSPIGCKKFTRKIKKKRGAKK